MNMESFAIRLRQERERKHLTQAQLAEQIGATSQTIVGYESTTDAKMPSLQNAIRLADALNISLDYLSGRTDTQNQKMETYGDLAQSVLWINRFDYANVNFQHGNAVVTFRDETITHFLEEYSQMSSLKQDDTISSEIFDLWLDGKIKQLQEITLRTNPLLEE